VRTERFDERSPNDIGLVIGTKQHNARPASASNVADHVLANSHLGAWAEGESRVDGAEVE
jgi:hypothetical protein